MKTFAALLLSALASIAVVSAEEFDARDSLGINAGRSVDAAIKRAAKEDKRVLVLALDPDKKNQGFHIRGMMEFEETKDLVKEHFILVVTDFKDKHIRDLVGEITKERPMYVLFNKDGTVAEKGTAAVGGKVGAELVKKWVAKS